MEGDDYYYCNYSSPDALQITVKKSIYLLGFGFWSSYHKKAFKFKWHIKVPGVIETQPAEVLVAEADAKNVIY